MKRADYRRSKYSRCRMEHYDALARAEIALGDLGSREKIGEYLKLAQDAAVELGSVSASPSPGHGDYSRHHFRP